MEIVLGALGDWIYTAVKNRVVKWILIGLVFALGCYLSFVELNKVFK